MILIKNKLYTAWNMRVERDDFVKKPWPMNLILFKNFFLIHNSQPLDTPSVT